MAPEAIAAGTIDGGNLKPQANLLFLSNNSATETRARVARVRAEYPDQLDYSGAACSLAQILDQRNYPKSYFFRCVLHDEACQGRTEDMGGAALKQERGLGLKVLGSVFLARVGWNVGCRG